MVGFDSNPFGFKIIIETCTKSLTLWHLTEDHIALKNLIQRLHDAGLSDAEIAIHLSKNKIPSKRGKVFWQAKNVWSVRKKFHQREKRLKFGTFKFIEITLRTPFAEYKIDPPSFSDRDISDHGIEKDEGGQ